MLGNDSNISDGFGDWFKKCYRWPGFGDEEITFKNAAAFEDTTDPEIKSVLLQRELSKHYEFAINFDINNWREQFLKIMQCKSNIRRSDLLPAYINPVRRATWPDFSEEDAVIGHCPVIILDAVKIWRDIPDLKFVHIVGIPLIASSISCDVTEILIHCYALKWKTVNDYALSLAKLYPQNVKLISLFELLSEKYLVMASICKWLQIGFDEINTVPTWLSCPLDSERMGQFGGVPDVNLERELRLIDQHAKQHDKLLKVCEGSLLSLNDFGIDLHTQ